MDWATDHATWPLTQHSRFILQKPHRWHVQELGPERDTAPLVLMIHGAGGATHSWRHLIPHLQDSYRIVAVDLPGQGFTQCGAQNRCGIDAMAEDLLSLCTAQGWHPHAIVGHSAGAAIALRMVELMDDPPPIPPRIPPRVIGINAALDTFQGVAGILFPFLAKTIAALPMAAELFSATMSGEAAVARIINGTGSKLPPEDLALYRRLVASRGHVNATLRMMAQWNLAPLLSRLPKNPARTLLIAGDHDTAVPHSTSINAARVMPNATSHIVNGLGHLAHETDAGTVSVPVLEALSAPDAPDGIP